MSDGASESIETKVDLRLADYVAVQFWCWKQALPRSAVIFLLAIFATVYVMDISDGVSLSAMFDEIAVDWGFYAAILAAAFLVTLILPIGTVILRWLRSGLPREMKISVGHEGVRVSMRDLDLHPDWSSVSSVSEDRLAYYVKGKGIAVRLPKRGFDEPQRTKLEDIVRNSVSSSANRLR